jgi:hypothetical protein
MVAVFSPRSYNPQANYANPLSLRDERPLSTVEQA